MPVGHTLTAVEHQTLHVGEKLPHDAYEAFKGRVDDLRRTAAGALELVHGGIRTGSFCGVLTAGKWSLEILPKIDSGQDPLKNRGLLLRMLGTCFDLPIWVDRTAGTDLGAGLLPVLIRAFLRAVSEQSRMGLLSRYEARSDVQPFLRGQLDVREHMKRSASGPTLIPCIFDDLTVDNAYNQALKYALKLSADAATNPASLLRKAIHRLLSVFDDVDNVPMSSAQISALPVDRLTARYREALRYAEWLVGAVHPDIRNGEEKGIAFLFDMNVLFERYVSKILGVVLKHKYSEAGLQLRAQSGGHQLLAADPTSSTSGLWIRPDIQIVKSGVVQAVLDTKWKVFAGKGPSTDDAYQMLAYGYGLGCDNLELIYPSLEEEEHKLNGRNYRYCSKMHKHLDLRLCLFNLNDPTKSAEDILSRFV